MSGRRPMRVGFTLVELLLVIVLVAVVLVETGIVLRTASRAYRRSRDQAIAAEMAADALWLIGCDVADVACPTDPSHPPVKAAATPLLRLRTTGAASGARPQVVDYFLHVDDDDRQYLIRRVEPITDLQAPSSSADVAWEIVAEDVEQFDMRFYDGATWADAWAPTAQAPIPTLVEITLAVAAGDGRTVTRTRVLPLLTQPPLAPGWKVTP